MAKKKEKYEMLIQCNNCSRKATAIFTWGFTVSGDIDSPDQCKYCGGKKFMTLNERPLSYADCKYNQVINFT